MIIKLLLLPFRLLRNLLSLLAYASGQLLRGFFRLILRKPQSVWATLELPSSYPMGHSAQGLGRWFGPSTSSLLELRKQLDHVAQHPRLAGCVVYIDEWNMGGALSGDVRDALGRVRASGKRVIMHTKEARLGKMRLLSVADDVVLTPAGRLYTFGTRIELSFYKAIFDKLGVEPQFIHVGAFKTATHPYHKTESTQAQSLMMRGLFRGMKARLLEDISTGRQVDQVIVEEAIINAPLDAHEARATGLVTGTSFRRDVLDWVDVHVHGPYALKEDGARAKPDKKRPSMHDIALDTLYNARPKLTWRPLLKRPRYIGVMSLSGPIATGGNGPGMPSRGAGINPDDVLPKLKALEEDSHCVGVLLHIDSPGGSALGSDLIWKAVMRLREKKPVVAYCSNVAASGGYYIAVAANAIVCRPETITGSIGVIIGKFTAPGLLEKTGMKVEVIKDEESSAFMSLYEPLGAHTMGRLKADSEAFYRRFLDRVGQARGIERRRLHRYARGRVYLGADALARGLVDDVTGLEGAIAKLQDLTPHDKHYPLQFVEHQKQSLRQTITRSLMAPQMRAHVERAQRALATQALLSDSPQVLALLPHVPKM